MKIRMIVAVVFAFFFIESAGAENFLDKACYDACANGCNRHLRSKNRRNCRNKCSRDCTRIVKNVKKVAKDAEKIARSIRDAGGEIIDTAENLWNALNDSGDYPSRLTFPSNNIDSPNVNFTIASSYLTKILQNFAETSISTNKKKDNNYVQLRNPRISFDSNLNIIVFESAGIIAGDFGKVRGALKAKALRIDLAPLIRTLNNEYFVDIFGKITYLDIEDSPPKLDKYIANAAHYIITQDKPLLSFNITDYVHFDQNINILNESRRIAFNVAETTIAVQGATLSIKAKIEPRDQMISKGE